ncbi:MAG: ABC transporter permease [Candidatus Odinarchaeota archaeon]
MSLLKYIIRRLLIMVPILFGVITLTFILTRLMPGDPVQALLPINADQDDYDMLEHALGYDRTPIEQYFIFIGNLFTGNWGESVSIERNAPVWRLVWDRLPVTIELAFFSIIIASYLGIKTGKISAKHRNKWQDTVFRGIALIGVSIPVFWMGMMVRFVFSNTLGWLPGTGFKSMDYSDPEEFPITGFRLVDALITGNFNIAIDYLQHLIMPVLCLSFITLASIVRQNRSSMLEVLEQDYIRTARAKGCREKEVINKHALKNALIPTVTIIGLNFGSLLGGAILTETTFNLHGLGELIVSAINQYDYFVISATVFFIALIFLAINLFTDLIYAYIDPRIRY